MPTFNDFGFLGSGHQSPGRPKNIKKKNLPESPPGEGGGQKVKIFTVPRTRGQGSGTSQERSFPKGRSVALPLGLK